MPPNFWLKFVTQPRMIFCPHLPLSTFQVLGQRSVPQMDSLGKFSKSLGEQQLSPKMNKVGNSVGFKPSDVDRNERKQVKKMET